MEKNIYISFPKSNTHQTLLRKIIGKNESIYISSRNIQIDNPFIGERNSKFFKRLISIKRIEREFKIINGVNYVFLFPMNYYLPSNNCTYELFEEGISAYQSEFIGGYKISIKTIIYDMIKIFLVNLILFNKSKVLKNIILGPCYTILPSKKNKTIKYYTTSNRAIVKEDFKTLLKPIKISFDQNKKIQSSVSDNIIFILDPIYSKNFINHNIFIDFLKSLSNNFSKIKLKLHPSDAGNENRILNQLDDKFEIYDYNIEEEILNKRFPDNTVIAGLASSLIYYLGSIYNIESHCYAARYYKMDDKYRDEINYSYGSLKKLTNIFDEFCKLQ